MKLIYAIIITTMTSTVFAQERLVVGKTYEIKERNALEEVKERAANIDMKKVYLDKRGEWIKKARVTPLPTALVDQTRTAIPWGVAPKDIFDKNGKLLYKKGFKFNPLKWLSMTFKLYVVNEEHIEWVKPLLKPMDRVILNVGDLSTSREKLGRDIFILDEPFKQKMNVEKVPSIISQNKHNLLIREVYEELHNETD